MLITACLFLLSGAIGLFPSTIISWSELPASSTIALVCFAFGDWEERPDAESPLIRRWPWLPVPPPPPDRTVTSPVDRSVLWRTRSLRLLIAGRAAVNGASVGGLLLLCVLQQQSAFDSSPSFWGYFYLWITVLCLYFACGQLHPQCLDYQCCCVTLATSFSFISSPSSYILSVAHFSAAHPSSAHPSSAHPSPLMLMLHFRWPVLSFLLFFAIPQIEISGVLKSLRQIYHLNEEEWFARGKRKVWCWVWMEFRFANFQNPFDNSLSCDGEIYRLALIWVSLGLTGDSNVTTGLSKETETDGGDVFLSSRGNRED